MNITLEHLRGGTYYFPLKYINVGLYMFKKNCVLIDAGSTEEEGQEIYSYLSSKGLILQSILVTHAHSDNIGGAYYIKNKTKAKLYSSREEALIIENPKRANYSSIVTEYREEEVVDKQDPRVNSRSDQPINFIPTKKKVPYHTVITHKKCLVDSYLQAGKTFVITIKNIKQKFDIISLPGHSVGQLGYVTPDSVFFIGDSLYSNEEISDNPIPYTYDLSKTKKTLDYLLKTKYTLFVPSHGKPLDFSITAEVYNNQRQIKMLEDTMLMHLQMPKTKDELIALVLASFDIEESVPNFFLISSTVGAYLDYLSRSNKLKAIHEKGKTRWFNDA